MRTSPHGPESPARRSAAPGRRSPRPRRAPALIVAVLAALAALVPEAANRPAAAAARPPGPLVPASGFYVGAYSKHNDGYGQDREQQATTDLESRLGRRLHIDHHYYAWNDAFPSWREPWDIQNDRIPMISWNGENTDAIARGDYDGMISVRAQAVAMLNTPVFIRWFWEMDGNKKAGFISSPTSYVKAWRHIHDAFIAAGATNVAWVWCPNASAFEDGEAQAYYPGASYVDWVCADGYNFAPNRPGDQWETFGQIFSGFYAAATRLNKPLMIGETGVLERSAGEKATWFRQAADWVTAHPAIAAVVYFNADSTNNGINYNWRVDTAPQSFEGFRALFSGPAPVPPADPVPSAAPDPDAPPEPLPDAPPPAAPRTSRPRGPAAPGADQTVADVAAGPAAATPGGRMPSPRLTWVLQLLRQLDAASVATQS
ncbi:MAG TPA: glycosyl hydrolase [Acidimicrobiia bacterium]|nr:glycosyl hydrolase [Acidimicrobiia bacterium]